MKEKYVKPVSKVIELGCEGNLLDNMSFGGSDQGQEVKRKNVWLEDED